MSELMNETMETMNEDVIDTENFTAEDCESGIGKAVGLVVAGLGVGAAVGAALCNKIKSAKKEKAEKPKKKRKKLMWVEVEDENSEDIISEDEFEDKPEEEPKKEGTKK